MNFPVRDKILILIIDSSTSLDISSLKKISKEVIFVSVDSFMIKKKVLQYSKTHDILFIISGNYTDMKDSIYSSMHILCHSLCLVDNKSLDLPWYSEDGNVFHLNKENDVDVLKPFSYCIRGEKDNISILIEYMNAHNKIDIRDLFFHVKKIHLSSVVSRT